ncbi:hypothetical protein CAEBREN_19426 [Caenorhabditis brenneri]|uniref:Uncharacterized protein n=1 Tax=Caenorhabditis brenneri TaxID=135651 RepID=G0N7W7_CAEBE|nr:hypothetical protein CAEBREN_19426 [Caenorhabditis brenneri]
MDDQLQPNWAQNGQNQEETIVPREIFVGLGFGSEHEFINFLVERLERERLMERTGLLIPLLMKILIADDHETAPVREIVELTEVIGYMNRFMFIQGESIMVRREMFIEHMTNFRFFVPGDDGDDEEMEEPQEEWNGADNDRYEFGNAYVYEDEKAENENEEEGAIEERRDLVFRVYQRAVNDQYLDDERAESEDEDY